MPSTGCAGRSATRPTGSTGPGSSTTLGASSLSLGALLKHLAAVEDYYSTARLSGAEWGEPWNAVDWEAAPGWEFTSAADDAPATLYALYDGAVARSRERFDAYLAEGDLGGRWRPDRPTRRPTRADSSAT